MEERERCYSFVLSLTTRDVVAFPSVANTHYSRNSLFLCCPGTLGVTYMQLALYPRRGRDISGVSADNYDIHGKKGEVIFFCSVPCTIGDVVAIPSVANTHYSKISLLVMLSWYFDMPAVTYIWRFTPGGVETAQV
jgi:hypothetical protein